MLVVVACLLAVLSPLLRRRSLAPLAALRLRGTPLVWAALAAQVLVVYGPLPEPAAAGLHLATYAAAAAVVWLNRSVPGVPLVGAGAALNGGTILLNGGTLPASPGAAAAAGLDAAGGFANSAPLADPVLPWLGDVFAWPQPLPLANVFSVGDVVVVLGVAWAGHRLTRSRARPEVRAT